MSSMKNKYRNTKNTFLGERFDSLLERDRWIFLKQCEKDGLITELKRQERIPLYCNEKHICDYIADFVYTQNGEEKVTDCKGILTDVFKLKAKLYEANYGKKITIIKKQGVTSL